MECPSCTFQNSPGLKLCLRCGGLLDFTGVAVEPPRARQGRAARRVAVVGQAAGRHAGYVADDLRRALRCPIDGVGWSDLALSILPGLPQVVRGPRRLGWWLLAVWGADLLLAAAFIGSGFSRLLCLFAVSLHCMALSLLLNPVLSRLPLTRRAALGLGLYVLLLLCLYRPAAVVGRRAFGWLEVSNFRDSAGVLANHDVVLYTGPLTRPASFRRGELVVYEIGPSSARGAVIRPGLGVERIIGIAGDTVETDHGVVRLNGEELAPEWGPIGDSRALPRMTLTAHEDEYILLPTVVRHTGHGDITGALTSALASLSLVREDRIRGRIFWRARPWSKAGLLPAPAAEEPEP